MQASQTLTQTLNHLAKLDHYNHWLFEQVTAALGEHVLEVGAGTGNITQFLRTTARRVMATDVVASYRQVLQENFKQAVNVRIGEFDLTAPATAVHRAAGYDSVICLNVLEHIEDDAFALKQMWEVLPTGGKLGLLVPAHQFLFGEFDRAVGHYRRYSRSELNEKLRSAGFSVLSTKFFSMAAMLPWFVNGCVLKRNYLPTNQASLADFLVPILKLERFIGPPCGISLVAIAVKL